MIFKKTKKHKNLFIFEDKRCSFFFSRLMTRQQIWCLTPVLFYLNVSAVKRSKENCFLKVILVYFSSWPSDFITIRWNIAPDKVCNKVSSPAVRQRAERCELTVSVREKNMSVDIWIQSPLIAASPQCDPSWSEMKLESCTPWWHWPYLFEKLELNCRQNLVYCSFFLLF